MSVGDSPRRNYLPNNRRSKNSYSTDHVNDVIARSNVQKPWSKKSTNAQVKSLSEHVIEREQQAEFSNVFTETPMYKEVINTPVYKPPFKAPSPPPTSTLEKTAALLPAAATAVSTSTAALSTSTARQPSSIALTAKPFNNYSGPERAGGGGLRRLATHAGRNVVTKDTEGHVSLALTSAMQHAQGYSALQRGLTSRLMSGRPTSSISRSTSTPSHAPSSPTATASDLPLSAATIRLHSAAAVTDLASVVCGRPSSPSAVSARSALAHIRPTTARKRPTSTAAANRAAFGRGASEAMGRTGGAGDSGSGVGTPSSFFSPSPSRPSTSSQVPPLPLTSLDASSSFSTSFSSSISHTFNNTSLPSSRCVSANTTLLSSRLVSSRVISSRPTSLTARVTDKRIAAHLQRMHILPRVGVLLRVQPPPYICAPQRLDAEADIMSVRCLPTSLRMAAKVAQQQLTRARAEETIAASMEPVDADELYQLNGTNRGSGSGSMGSKADQVEDMRAQTSEPGIRNSGLHFPSLSSRSSAYSHPSQGIPASRATFASTSASSISTPYSLSTRPSRTSTSEGTRASTGTGAGTSRTIETHTISSSSAPHALHTARRALDGTDRVVRSVIREHMLRAQACRRAARHQGECGATYSVGVLLDNLREYTEACRWYRRTLDVATAAYDREMMAVAHNAMGVSLSRVDGAEEAALWHHEQHLSVANAAGAFTAYTNCGLLLSRLTRYNEAVAAHRSALECAVNLANDTMTIAAVGNLGFAAMRDGDMVVANASLEEFVRMVDDREHLRDLTLSPRAEALTCLGEMAHANGDEERAMLLLHAAIETATQAGESDIIAHARVALGVCAGTRAANTPHMWSKYTI